MKLGLRTRLFLVSLGLIALGGGAAGLFLERQLEQAVTTQTEERLRQHAALAAEALAPFAAGSTIEVVDPIADALGAAGEVRVTVIARNGQVLGDSDLDLGELRSVELHNTRPEVVEALSHGTGVSTRYSTTVETNMLYVARDRGPGLGTVRVATPLSAVQQAVRRLRLALLLASGIGLVVAILMSALASHLTTRPLLLLVERARRLVEQDGAPDPAADEVGTLAGSLDHLAHELDESVSALARERDQLDAVLGSMGEGVVGLDSELRVRVINSAAHAFFDIDGDAEGRMLVEICRVPAMHDLATRALSETTSCELTLGPAGRQVAAFGAPLRATGGALLVLRDVTEVRRLEAIRRDFVANISHELRTPVSVIRANSETLLDGALQDPVQGRRFAEANLRHAERLSNLLTDLLDLAKLESEAYGLELRPVALTGAFAAALNSVRTLAERRTISLNVDAPEGLEVEADPQALEQVLINLLENAVKYTQQGGHIVIVARATDGQVRVDVCDDGPGVEREHRDRLFERFYRVDAGRSREVGGTGLGLSIVKHLVGAMNGEVGMEPNKPNGSRFWFSLRTASGSAEADGAHGSPPATPRDASAT